jgi:hypothetical protein
VKEVVVEKIIEVKNEKEILELTNENKKLKDELDNITKSLNSMNRAKYMKNSDMGSLYSE